MIGQSLFVTHNVSVHSYLTLSNATYLQQEYKSPYFSEGGEGCGDCEGYKDYEGYKGFPDF